MHGAEQIPIGFCFSHQWNLTGPLGTGLLKLIMEWALSKYYGFLSLHDAQKGKWVLSRKGAK